MADKNVRSGKLTSSMQRKLVVLFFAVLLAFACLIFRIAHINRDNGEAYKKQVLAQQAYDSATLPYKRGSIEDRNGTVLAYSEKVYNLIVDSKLMNVDDGVHVGPTVEVIKKAFGELNDDRVGTYVNTNKTASYKKFLKQIRSDRVENFNAILEQTISENEVKRKELREAGRDAEADAIVDPVKNGVWFEEEYKRTYPYNSLACDVIGFVQSGNEGQYGLEQYYNDTLNGINGRSYGYLNTDGTLTRTVKEAEDGYTLVTSLDTNIQSIVEKHILDFAEKNKNAYRTGPAANNIGVIIMNPNNGEIYAMAGYPVFNLNDPQNMEGIDLTQYASLLSKEDLCEAVGVSMNSISDNEIDLLSMVTSESLSDNSIVKSAVWKNFCISDTFEPGSTMKPFTVAAAVDDASITGNETYVCNGALDIGEHTIHCHNRLGDGPLTVKEGIAKSCNVVLMDVAFAMGKSEWLRYNRNFGFGNYTGIDLYGEANGAANTFTEKMGQTDLAVASFGQGFNVSMIQLAAGFAALINGGDYYEPHLVTRILNSEGAVMSEKEPREIKQVISEEASDMIRDFCNSVVMNDPDQCTGWTARPAGYTMGGKTGTAEKLPRSAKNYVISFIGYVPNDDPEVLCYVVIDTPNHADQSNSTRLATTLCKDIMTEVLPYLNIFPTEALTEEEMEQLSDAEANFYAGRNTVSANSVSENSVSENAMTEVGENGGNEGGEASVSENAVNVIQYDPGTGFPIDPNTGEVLDPNTLLPINEDYVSDLDF